MPLAVHTLPLASPALPCLARWLLPRLDTATPESNADALVLLPSQRACVQLAHALLEQSDRPALVLPRFATPGQFIAELADLADPAAAHRASDLPDLALRPLLLAPRLARLDWLRDRPEAAAGLAVELIALFDEVRLARLDAPVLDARDDASLRAGAEPGAEEVLQADLERIRAAWRLYRELMPRDQIDHWRHGAERAGERWPGTPPPLVVVAHLGRLHRVAADLLRALADAGSDVRWVTFAADDPRSLALLATYRDERAAAHPLAVVADIAARLGVAPAAAPALPGADLPARLDALGRERLDADWSGRLALRSCRDPEHESRVVARTVCVELAAAQREGRPAPRILVATADRGLAARIAAQLEDAGVALDDSRGRPLATLPAGRLLLSMLRTVVEGWPYTTLLELLTHPDVRCGTAAQRPSHAVKVLVLEAAVRRAARARRGLEPLLAIAAQDDLAATGTRSGWSLQEFVADVDAGLAPLSGLAAGAVAWRDVLAAIAAVWRVLVPQRPLDGDPEPRFAYDDLGALAGLLDALGAADAWLQPAPLADIAAAIGDLLAGPACEVRPHRRRELPVRLLGLVEARLEHADLLVLAGMAQEVFPGRLARPLLLADRVRRSVGLEHWRLQAARAGELFLRLLHGADRLVMTWPRERDGRPALASPLLQRLLLSAPAEAQQEADEPRLYRKTLPDGARLVAAEAAYRAEPEPIPAPAVPPPPRLSHSALQNFRECPYRFLMANALALRRPDPVEAAFTAADAGSLAHAVMQRWLAVGGPGSAALAVGDRPAARKCLLAAAQAVYRQQGKHLPGAAVSLQALLALADDLVEHEARRAEAWTPGALECRFTVTVGQAAAWLSEASGEPVDDVPQTWRAFELSGVLDRVDRRRDGSAAVAVIDYKTGVVPSRTSVRDGRELQIHLYALAVEAGAVEGLPAAAGSPWRVDHAGYYGLRRLGLGLPAPPHLDAREDLVGGVRAILSQTLAILDPQTTYALVPQWQSEAASGQLPCRICEVRGICRVEERDTTPALAARLGALLAQPPRVTP